MRDIDIKARLLSFWINRKDEQISFVRDEKGVITELIIQAGGRRDIIYEKIE